MQLVSHVKLQVYSLLVFKLQVAAEEHRRVKEGLSEQLHWAQSSLSSLQAETAELRKENQRQRQRLQVSLPNLSPRISP
jgi:hypothetical protein